MNREGHYEWWFCGCDFVRDWDEELVDLRVALFVCGLATDCCWELAKSRTAGLGAITNIDTKEGEGEVGGEIMMRMK